MVHAEFADAFELVIGGGGGEDGGAGAFGELDGGDADAAGAALDEDGLAGLEIAEFEQAIVGGAEGDGDGSGLLDIEAIGDGPAGSGGDGDDGRMGAGGHGADDALAGTVFGDGFAGFADGAGALVADDVGGAWEFATGAVEDIAAFDADGFHIDNEPAGVALGIGEFFVAEDRRGAGLVIDGSFHGETSQVGRCPGRMIVDRRGGVNRGRVVCVIYAPDGAVPLLGGAGDYGVRAAGAIGTARGGAAGVGGGGAAAGDLPFAAGVPAGMFLAAGDDDGG